MLIGMNVMKDLHVYIAFKERKLYITAAAPAKDRAPDKLAAPGTPETEQ
jgi:hypothetical protein